MPASSSRIDPSQKPLALAIAGLVFIGPTILAYGKIMVRLGTCIMVRRFEHG